MPLLPSSNSVLFLTSLLAIPLASQSCLHAFLFTGLQIVGVTLYFLDDVLLLYLSLEPAQRVLERFAFLNTNLCQNFPPPNLPGGKLYDTGNMKISHHSRGFKGHTRRNHGAHNHFSPRSPF